MIKKLTLLIALLSILSVVLKAQEKEAFKPYGKPSMRVFSNFHTTTSNGETAPAFELTRVYLGYDYFITEKLSAKTTLDVGDPGVGKLQMTAYVKNALLKYSDDKLTVNFGLIPTLHFEAQEANWGFRYVAKSFQDEYKMASSADLGVSISYKLLKSITVDASMLNGEGFRSLQADSVFKYTAGITLLPIKGLTVRGGFDTMKKTVNQNSVNAFVGYAAKKFTVGAEYNLQNNFGLKTNQNLSGTSMYASFVPTDKMKVFARFDQLTSNIKSGDTDPWNLSKNGQLLIAGLEFAPAKGVKVSPNVQNWNPAKTGDSNRLSVFLNVDLKF